MNRAFRLTFNHAVGKFVIEIQGFAGMSWKAVKEGAKVRYFDTFSDAVDHVKKIGLDKVYADFTFQKPYGSTAPTRGPTLAEISSVYGAPRPATWSSTYPVKESA